jgi:hypothetical protein
MTIEACVTFLREIADSDELKQQMKAVTGTKEVVAIGKRYGYAFDSNDIMAASSTLGEEATIQETRSLAKEAPSNSSAFYHYEFDMGQISGFEPVVRELNNLKIKPASVDFDLYQQSFRADDFQFTTMSPAEPGFKKRYTEIMQTQWQRSPVEHEFSRRDFHLINLDHHTEHPLYHQYFQAKARVISSLEDFFGAEVRFSGSMWYPPSAYRLWHTNETQAGWRMYLIDFDEDPRETEDTEGKSFFRYMNPQSKEIITLEERPQIVRFFKVEQEKEKLFWHCIVNATRRNRWSFGFAVPESWMNKLFRGV